MKQTNKQSIKQILISIALGACAAFFSTLFSSLAEFMKSHSTEIMSGGVTAFYHAIKTYKV